MANSMRGSEGPAPSPLHMASKRKRPGKRERKATVTTANPAEKKKHHFTIAREKADALDALLKEHGVSSVDELNTKLAALTLDAAVETYGPDPAPTSPDQPVVDPLVGITRETPYVELVSSTSMFVLRQLNKHYNPHITRIAVHRYRVGPWDACPFRIGCWDERLPPEVRFVRDRNIKIFKAQWHHFRVTRQLAENVYADPRWPRPETHVVDPKTFRGWDRRSNQAVGEHVPIEDFVALREVVRYMLQKARETFLDYATRPKGFEFDPRFPNPYRNKITDVARETTIPRSTLSPR